MNQKGQALVEFILIVPVILFLIIGGMELGNIVLQKYRLENDLDTICELYQAGKLEKIQEYASKQDIEVEYLLEDSYITIQTSKEVSIATPLLSHILNNPYTVTSKKVLFYES